MSTDTAFLQCTVLPHKVLEVCADSFDSAVCAQKAGAMRIELCANLIVGGTTPTQALTEAVVQALSIPVHVLIRPRFGDFYYSASETECMKRDIALSCEAGAAGIVIGCLQTDGSLDTKKLKALMQAAKEAAGSGKKLSFTLHRAFDMCKDPLKAFEQAGELGFDTVLTSGQAATCWEGQALLSELVSLSRANTNGVGQTGKAEKNVHYPAVMAGSGLKPEYIVPLAQKCGINCFHLSGKKIVHSPMLYKNKNVSMSFKGMSEYELWTADEKTIAEARRQFNML